MSGEKGLENEPPAPGVVGDVNSPSDFFTLLIVMLDMLLLLPPLIFFPLENPWNKEPDPLPDRKTENDVDGGVE